MTRIKPRSILIPSLLALTIAQSAMAIVERFTISYTVAGLTANSGLVVTDGTDTVPVSAAGTFSFPTPLTSGSAYNVTVSQLPSNPMQYCTVTGGTGTVNNADVTAPRIVCAVRYGRFAYDFADNTIEIYAITAAGQWVHRGYITTTDPVAGLALHPSSQILYVVSGQPQTFVSGQISPPPAGTATAYTIDGSTGELTVLNSVPVGSNPDIVKIDSQGNYLYVANSSSDGVNVFQSISVLKIDPRSSKLSAASTFNLPNNADSLFSLTLDASGHILTAAQPDIHSIATFLVNTSSGTLTAGPTTMTGPGSLPGDVEIDPTGRFAYVDDFQANTIQAFSLNASTGALTAVGTPLAAGGGANFIAIDPASKFVFVSNPGHGIAAFSIDSNTGALTAVGQPIALSDAGFLMVDPSGNFLHVTNPTTGTIQTFHIDRTSGRLSAVGSVAARVGLGGLIGRDTLAITKSSNPGQLLPKFAYSLNVGSDSVSSYTINSSTGALTPVNSIVFNGTPTTMALDLLATRAVVGSNTAPVLDNFTINATSGALTQTSTSQSSGGIGSVIIDPSGKFTYTLLPAEIQCFGCATTPLPLANESNISFGIEPTGQFLYVTAKLEQAISVMSIDPNSAGALTQVGAVSTVEQPDAIAFHPSGRFAYTVDGTASIATNATATSSTVRAYAISPQDGSLNKIGPAISTQGQEPISLAVSPNGAFLYVLDLLSADISTFAIDPGTGALTHETNTSLGSASAVSLSIDPSGQFLYVPNRSANTLLTFRINPTTGALTALTPSNSAGNQPFVIQTTGVFE